MGKQDNKNDEFIGTYQCIENKKISISASPDDSNAFYYTDQENNIYIKGHFKKQK